MMNARSSSNSSSNRPPFTASQWQELEQQALVFKYMVSGTPIPPDLIFSIKRSLDYSISPTRLFPHHPIGWGCFDMGFGRKIDPEPGRCRRTDGKKWRCSKEAYPDSKYCEKHMHRGRNRSRKPVEVVSSSSSSAATTTTNTISSSLLSSYNNNNNNLHTTSSSSSISESSIMSQYPNTNFQNSSLINPFFYSHSTTSRPHGPDFSPHHNTTHHLFGVSYSQQDKDYRHIHHGMREDVDERAFFPEASGTARSFPDSSYHQLSMSPYNKSYSNSHHFQNLTHNNNNNSNPRQEQHCFVLGTDFKSARASKSEKDETTHRPLHHFFGDHQWPPKTTDSWLDLASNSTIPTDE